MLKELHLFKEKKYDNFKRLAEETWSGLQIRDLYYDVSQSEYIQLMVQDAGFPAEIGLMGSGIQMWLQIIWFISRLDKNETIILDEPDVYMHPDMQRKILKIVKSTFPQVIIVTHSIELISEVDPKYILKIDKMTRNMKYCTDLKAVQNIVDNIGSAQNLSLMRLGDFRKCLFVEGNDIKILSKFYEILYPDNEFSLEMIPWISLGGWSRFNEALGTSKLFYEETSNMIKTICILDHDYHLENEINELFKRAEESKLILHVWERKEIENYILVPEVIFRVTGLDKQYYSEFYNELNSKLDIFKVDVVDHYAKQFGEINRSKDPITCNREAREFIENKWNTVEEKFALVNGKDAIKLINRWIKEKYNITCSRSKILSKFTVDDVPNDMKKVIELII
ncbi:AAA family ATPase [Clostridium fallax]|uniref:AAA domain-containing protein, putative AbiEii toxin, Type IV TA system n=1 Tax=Clostridium fallax TaxID=1533 RepID=A0A1M4YLM8_9CLOT|nr:AAA family ATPase [Clostridium fallax]SHF06725.1 AAA domain-containing protein, putative AbiEii toxin, Type IV TA system [Clostridium fallax]SQB06459.1 Predicted ATPase [Clostridium fallax]